ncbi:hypothetical protein FDECE_13030 [Fusarium decemcellulare]|nr:hypothetical protein FDECE_13030 [Fusarium decemcellulare]
MRRLLLFILTFGGQALAALPNDVTCSSLLGPNKVAKIPTSTVSVTQKITVTKKVVLKVQRVVLGPAKTITSTSTSTSTSTTIADPATKTATVFESKAEWVTETRYATSTVITEEVKTVSYSTVTTIFPSPGFQSAKQVPGYVPKFKVRDAPAKIVGLPKNMQVVRVKGIPGNQKVVAVPEQYVQRVDCTKRIRSSSTVTTKVTVTASNIYPPPATKTKMVTVTETQTSTVYPADATTTITSTDTATFTTTTTIYGLQSRKQVKDVKVSDKVLISHSVFREYAASRSDIPAYCDNRIRLIFGGRRIENSCILSLEDITVPQESQLNLFAPLGCSMQTLAGSIINALDVNPERSFTMSGVVAVCMCAIIDALFRPAATVIAVDINAGCLEVSKTLEATHTILTSNGGDVYQVKGMC